MTSQTLEDATALGLVPQRIVVSVAGGLGLIGALLAAIGIYGVAAYAVARRTREIGIRMALGAQRADVVAMVLHQGIWLAVIGSAIGLLLAAGASRALVVFLFGIAAARSGDLRRRRRALCGRRPRGLLLARAARDADRSADGAALRVA